MPFEFEGIFRWGYICTLESLNSARNNDGLHLNFFWTGLELCIWNMGELLIKNLNVGLRVLQHIDFNEG